MKITKIEREGVYYSVTKEPNFIERLFGVKKRIDKYKETLRTYTFGGGSVYINKEGEETGNRSYVGESIDNWRRRF